MEKECYKNHKELLITAEKLNQADLEGFDNLELRTASHSIIILPGEMSAVELLATCTDLKAICADLMLHILMSCSDCDKCGKSTPCELMTAPILPEVMVPVEDMIEAGIEPGHRLTCVADPENNRLIVQESEDGYSLTDIDAVIIDTFRDAELCLRDLKELIEEDPIVYPGFKGISSD